jgi:DNA-binding CsgD family transcriptional regulator/tetratricopeptide (TPR) repeat protein
LISALEGWAESSDAGEVDAVLDLVPAAGELMPSLGGYETDSSVRLLSVVDALVMAIASHRATVLVVDDVQWADLASRDALAYLVAGFRRQQLAILATYRDEGLAAGDPMYTWVADLRRLPSVTDLRLDRLTRSETEHQLSMLLGGHPHHQLVDDVIRRSDGNPYLSELLVQGVTLAADELPTALPVELRDALLAAWHRLSPHAREVMRLLAIAGRPASIANLREVAGAGGIGPEALITGLAEATSAGISVAQGPDMCWFRHPLLAEVLCGTFVPGEAESIHAAWAKALQNGSSNGLDELRRQGDLALHYEGAQNLEAALEASLNAADLAKRATAPREEAAHLRRAARLWPNVRRGDVDHVHSQLDLVERVARVNDLVGDSEGSFASWSGALDLVDEHSDPLRASRLLRHWARSAMATGRTTGPLVAEARRAVVLSHQSPDSAEFAEALAYLSWRLAWSNELELSRNYAEEAVRAAHRSGARAALSLAYAVRGHASFHSARSDRDTSDALDLARMTGDPEFIWRILMIRQGYLFRRGRVMECVETATDFLAFALGVGALSVAVFTAGLLAQHLLIFGRLAESEDVLREGLSLAGLPDGSALTRLSATCLAVRRGNLEAAGLHVRRAKELMPAIADNSGLAAQHCMAEYLLALGQPQHALDLLTRTMAAKSPDPRDSDELLMWGARAAADLAESARDQRDSDGVQRAQVQLDQLVGLRQDIWPPPFDVIASGDLIQPALEALFTAESARCRAGLPTSSAWGEAVSRCGAAGMRWEEAIASWRWAQALLYEGASRADVAVPLRSAYRFAVEVGANPLARRAESLATIGRIRLDEPHSPVQVQSSSPFHSLTKREREVLSYLVAGRTYGEIARALFISEGTVSVHVSNMLRKTGTSSRWEVSALALRLAHSDPL